MLCMTGSNIAVDLVHWITYWFALVLRNRGTSRLYCCWVSRDCSERLGTLRRLIAEQVERMAKRLSWDAVSLGREAVMRLRTLLWKHATQQIKPVFRSVKLFNCVFPNCEYNLPLMMKQFLSLLSGERHQPVLGHEFIDFWLQKLANEIIPVTLKTLTKILVRQWRDRISAQQLAVCTVCLVWVAN